MQISKQTLTAIFTLFLFATITSGQNSKIDSLEILLKRHVQVDTSKVNLLNALGYEEFCRDASKAKSYAQQSWEMSTQLNYPRGKAASLWLSGLVSLRTNKKEGLNSFRMALKIAKEIDDKPGMCNYLIAIGNVIKDLGDIKASNTAYQQALQFALGLNDKHLILKCRVNISRNMDSSGNNVEAVKQMQEVITLAKEIDDKQILAGAYGNLGLVYRIQGDYATAQEYFLLALQLNEKRADNSGILSNLINIGGIQTEQGEFNTALETVRKALQLSTERGDSMMMSVCFTNIGNIYGWMNRPGALNYYKKALIVCKGSNIGQNISTLMSIGGVYTTQGEFEKAAQSLSEALVLAQKVGMKSAIGEVYVKMGILYLKQKRYEKAIDCIQKAISLAEKIRYIELQQNCNRLFAKIHAATGNFKEAYKSHVQYKLLSDSLLSEKNTRKIAFLESSYKFAKEREVYELEKSGRELRIKSQQQLILLLVVISLLVILLSFAIYWSGRLRKKVLKFEIESINRELEANQKEMAVAKLKLIQNSERDVHNVKMLEDIGKNTVGEEHRNLCTLINNYKLQAHHSNWEEFETLFTKINKSFWDKLNELNPTLTPNERKLCAFLKLNMSNKDIALITFQSEEALKKSRLRLRKKLNIDRNTNLMTFIHSLSSENEVMSEN